MTSGYHVCLCTRRQSMVTQRMKKMLSQVWTADVQSKNVEKLGVRIFRRRQDTRTWMGHTTKFPPLRG